MKKIPISLQILFLFTPLFPQSVESSILSITAGEIKGHMQVLASDSMEGRKTGEQGIDKARDYLVNEFSQLGLIRPPLTDQPYLQEFPMYRSGWREYFFVQGIDTIRFRKDFLVQGNMPELQGDYDYVFAGFGIDEAGYNNYKGLDVKGKIVVYFIGEPKDKAGNYLTTGTRLTAYPRYEGKKDSIAFSRGALSTIRIDPSVTMSDRLIKSGSTYGSVNMLSIKPPPKKTAGNRNYVYTGIASSSRIMGIPAEQLNSIYQSMENGQKKFPLISGKVRVKAVRYPDTVLAGNVAGLVEGSDLKDEVVIITAHYDHLGKGEKGIRYGADDNASGTTGVLEIAEAFSIAASSGYRPRRSILFLPVTAEEMGLLGSQYYCSHPLFPLEKTFAVLNMDMIGRHDEAHGNKGKYVYVYVSEQDEKWLHETGVQALKDLTTDLIPEFQYKSTSQVLYGGSDHMPFEQRGIPVMYFFNGIHPDFHKPTDTWDKIDYEQMQETVRFVFTSAWHLANQDNDRKANSP